jgi:hypothetical protein
MTRPEPVCARPLGVGNDLSQRSSGPRLIPSALGEPLVFVRSPQHRPSIIAQRVEPYRPGAVSQDSSPASCCARANELELASRAGRRVRGLAPTPDPDLLRQREVVDAFLASSRAGDFEALVEVLAPDAVFRVYA